MNLDKLTKIYGDKIVVDEIELNIPKGKVVSFIGPNGAGKSSVFNMIARLIESDGGSISFMDKDIHQWNRKELSKQLAILTQSNNINMKLTVAELVSFGRFPYSGSRLTSEDHQKIDEAISYMELNDIKDCYIDELSGGQQQRAYIAMIIAQDTSTILLDEPTNNLDIYHARNLMRMVRRLSEELGKTIILVLHDINFASFYSDYICAMKDGKIAKYGTVNEVITEEVLSDIYGVHFKVEVIDGKPLSIYY